MSNRQRRRGGAWKAYRDHKPPIFSICPVCQSLMTSGRKRRKLLKAKLVTKDHIIPMSQHGWPFRSPIGVLNVRFMCSKCNSILSNFSNCVGALACHLAVRPHD